MRYRPLGTTGIEVSVVAMGCWPIAGVTALGVDAQSSVRTLETAFDRGITFYDTAYAYGRNGEADQRIVSALGHVRNRIAIASKAGIHLDEQNKPVRDGRPETLRRQVDETLRRLKTDRVELLYLHAPDPNVPVAESAGALEELRREGKALGLGVSNATIPQLEEFAAVAPIAAVQPCYNLLQRDIESDVIPWCVRRSIAVFPYWPLLKGLLAGKLPRDHVFDERDGRKKYPMFQGDEWLKNQDLLDDLRPIARSAGCSLAQLAVAWVIAQPGITAALCGAKRPDQVEETAAAANLEWTDGLQSAVNAALARRGTPIARTAI